MAENVAESLTKGTRVVVIGRLQQRSWEDHDGNKRSRVRDPGRRGRPIAEVGDRVRAEVAALRRRQSAPEAAVAAAAGDWGAPAPVRRSAPADEGGF